MDDLISEFIAEASQSLDEIDARLAEFADGRGERDALNHIFRAMHTIKGASGFLNLTRIGALAHAAESVLGALRDDRIPADPRAIALISQAASRLRMLVERCAEAGREPRGDDGDLIENLERAAAGESETARNSAPADVEALDRLMKMACELAVIRDEMERAARRLAGPDLQAFLRRLSGVAEELEHRVMTARLQPIGAAWRSLPLVVRQCGRMFGKTIDLEVSGAELEVDLAALAPIKDAVTHLVRNACDHGLETTAARVAAGKPEAGRITLSASRENAVVLIELSDDGSGLDAAMIRRKAVEAGLIDAGAAAAMSDERAQRLIFEPGVSTAVEVTQISGRGVGLDVAAASVERLGGAITVGSRRGEGTTFTLAIPETSARAAQSATSPGPDEAPAKRGAA